MNDPRHGPGSSAGDGIAANVEDRFLVAAAIENPRAFESLFTRYWDPIYRYCLYRMGNDEDAEDAAIRILTNAFNALPRLLYQNDGNMQFCFRFSLDNTPYLLQLFAVGAWSLRNKWVAGLAALGVLVNFWGAVAFRGYTEYVRNW